MINADNHRADAMAVLVADPSAATSHALLAVEARLAELVQQQRIATAIAATQCGVVFYEPGEFRQVRAAVRRLLGLPDQSGEQQ